MAIVQKSSGDPDDRSDSETSPDRSPSAGAPAGTVSAGSSRSALRPSFAERDAFRTALSQAYADGRIDDAEFERRSTLVETGSHAADLRQALSDLPQPEVEFPTTLTRAEALDRRRRLRASPAPTISRRILLAGGAAALGFVVAGGASRLFGAEPQSEDSAESTEAEVDFTVDPAALDTVLKAVKDKGYTQFTLIAIDPDVIQAGARSLKSARGIDSITAYGDGDLDITPSSRLSDYDELFTLDDFALDLIPAMVRAAEEKLGSKQGVRVELGTGIGVSGGKAEPVISVLVDGGDYREGGGELRWTADGEELVSIHRAGED